ncbi:MAG: vWA domain-containing protein [Acidobacteriota bacterium]
MLILAGRGWAQGTASSHATIAAQFVLVIDDSGSMGGRGGNTDPDRLAIFATRAFLGLLDDRDEATIVRLNGPYEGEAPPPIAPLEVHRERLHGMLDDTGALAAYDGDYTRCASALETVRELLDAAYRPNVAQVVVFLTDGRCTPQEAERPSADSFLNGLKAFDRETFQFYLLRFEGLEVTPSLIELARKTGGQMIEVPAEDPLALLRGFADALARSQGYTTSVLTPSTYRLPTHRGAERVRLLAVASDAGPDLALRVAAPGSPPRMVGEPVVGRHRFRQGKTYRFATLDYRPSKEPVEVTVDGAGAAWRVLAVPEYHLELGLQVRRGLCAQAGSVIQSASVGESICIEAMLRNRQGEVVSGDLNGDNEIRAKVEITEDGRSRSRPMNQVGEEARFILEMPHLSAASWDLAPAVTIDLGEGLEPIELALSARGFQIGAYTIEPQPAQLAFGELRPGDAPPAQAVTFSGAFQKTRARLEVPDRSRVPGCITFTISGVAEGEPFNLTPEQPYTVAARVAPFCDVRTFQETIDSVLRLALDAGVEAPQVGAVEIPFRVRLINEVEIPRELEVELEANQRKDVDLVVQGSFTRPLELEADTGSWPDGLEVEAVRPDAKAVPVIGRHTTTLRVTAGRCCDAGTHQSEIVLRPVQNDGYAEPPPPIVVPLTVHVTRATKWACHGAWVITVLLVLLLILLVAYLFSMIRNSRFLSSKELAASLVPLAWGMYGDTRAVERVEPQVRNLVRRRMKPAQRFLNWLRANPLLFGLPGRRYRETLELSLQPDRNVDRSSVTLQPRADLYRELENDPQIGLGKLFVSASGAGTYTFYTVPRNGRIGRLVRERSLQEVLFSESYYGQTDSQARTRLVELRRREKLIVPLPDEEREEGGAAGWELR